MLLMAGLPPKAIPILLTVRELDHGGIERDVRKIALNLNRSRFEPHVASYKAEGMRFEELSRARVPFLHLPLSSLKSLSAMTFALYTRMIRRPYSLFRLLKLSVFLRFYPALWATANCSTSEPVGRYA